MILCNLHVGAELVTIDALVDKIGIHRLLVLEYWVQQVYFNKSKKDYENK